MLAPRLTAAPWPTCGSTPLRTTAVTTLARKRETKWNTKQRTTCPVFFFSFGEENFPVFVTPPRLRLPPSTACIPEGLARPIGPLTPTRPAVYTDQEPIIESARQTGGDEGQRSETPKKKKNISKDTKNHEERKHEDACSAMARKMILV